MRNVLVVWLQDWWLDHLRHNSSSSSASSELHDLSVLKWVYGNIVNGTMEQFMDLQKMLQGGTDRDNAIIELYGKIADRWRHIQVFTDKRDW